MSEILLMKKYICLGIYKEKVSFATYTADGTLLPGTKRGGNGLNQYDRRNVLLAGL